MALEFVLFDLDDTLYPKNRLMPSIDALIITFLEEILQVDAVTAEAKRVHYNETYGTVIRGLLQEETVDIDAYLNYIHDIPVMDLLDPDPILSQVLADIPLQKHIFTNSYAKHAEKVIDVLGIREHFGQIFDIKSVNYVSKPASHPYKVVVSMLNTTPRTCIFIDDKVPNLREPKKLGMKTILVDDGAEEADQWVDASITDIHDIGKVIRQLVKEDEVLDR